MDAELLDLAQASLTARERLLVAMTCMATVQRLGYVPDGEDLDWLAQFDACSLGEDQLEHFVTSLRDDTGEWRAIMASLRHEDVRPTFVTTHALANPLLPEDMPFPWLRLDACSDAFAGDVHGENIHSHYNQVSEALHEASPSPGLRRAVNGASMALSIVTGGFLGGHGLGFGAGYKSGQLIGQASDKLLAWLADAGDEAGELATLVVAHTALLVDEDAEGAQSLSTWAVEAFVTAQRQLLEIRTDLSSPAAESRRQLEHLLRLLRVVAEIMIGQAEEQDHSWAPVSQLPDLSGFSVPDARLVLGLLGLDDLEVDDAEGMRSVWNEANWTVASVIPSQRVGPVRNVKLQATKS